MPTLAGPADLLLRNAPVYDAGGWVGDHLAVRRGRIVGRARTPTSSTWSMAAPSSGT